MGRSIRSPGASPSGSANSPTSEFISLEKGSSIETLCVGAAAALGGS
ncbi:MAG: hypothetical protein WDN49_05740 [Acetobacteraceae bacterium]